jgi:serine/threonine protein kinase
MTRRQKGTYGAPLEGRLVAPRVRLQAFPDPEIRVRVDGFGCGTVPRYQQPDSIRSWQMLLNLTKSHEMVWVDCSKWRERWTFVKKLPSGGQGESFRVRRTSDGKEAFLKTIRVKTDRERRARFFREASVYDTFHIEMIPRLIESNAHHHENADFEPYLATEFIEGPTLREWRATQNRVELTVAIATTRSLLQTLRNCHAGGCIHRDIKPDNIILIEADPARPALLDFGLNFREAPDNTFETEQGQEIGNRFLRLPELAAGSFLKQDLRSDLSFAGGILFYLLTGQHPDILEDAEGRLPHQRSHVFAILQDVAGVRLGRLLSVFDRTFIPQIADRFDDATAMLASIDRIMEDKEIGRSQEDDLNAILEIIGTAAERRRVATAETITNALRQVDQVHRELRASLGGVLEIGQTNFIVKGDLGTNTLFWFKPGSDRRVMSTTYEVQELGDEMIIRMSGETVFRTSIASPKYDEQFKLAVRGWLIGRVLQAVQDSQSF